jgi:hypothetical protein
MFMEVFPLVHEPGGGKCFRKWKNFHSHRINEPVPFPYRPLLYASKTEHSAVFSNDVHLAGSILAE